MHNFTSNIKKLRLFQIKCSFEFIIIFNLQAGKIEARTHPALVELIARTVKTERMFSLHPLLCFVVYAFISKIVVVQLSVQLNIVVL